MSVAIVTKYLGPTNTKGARIKATSQIGSAVVAWDHGLSDFQNHEAAATKLIAVNGWHIVAAAGAWLPGSYAAAVFICD